ncbi:DUF3179 domain-containing protein [Marinobacterium arenosum]|uniref:DUF3179 domain-containing protein n=1 Tax=Marinobacterium arenosum TaxID=2862496 RepID=UPI001C939F96|nr:DUF3179 domain-containing protein [Marinobacterium arenosum]MBY4678515.1 DUF3179 domain-containing protein [Marinobacterium arenosum]
MSYQRVVLILLVLLLLPSLTQAVVGRDRYNDFDLRNSLIPAQQILPGGPPKDGIPAIDNPKFVSADSIDWLHSQSQLLALEIDGQAKGYPIAILNWHEVVNDSFGDQSVVITYCPLCGTGMAFLASVEGQSFTFGVSGLLYNSDVLLYDRQTDSLWSQILAKAVTGPVAGSKLRLLPLQQMTWQAWRQRYPQGQVLSRDTGFKRNYDRDPYSGYDDSTVLFFPVEFLSKRYHPKERVLGITINDRQKAYPFAELARTGQHELRDSFAGEQLLLRFDASARTGSITRLRDNQLLPAINAFWFAWYTFYPKTEVFQYPPAE